MKFRALIINQGFELAMVLPSLLNRAGFVVDMITTNDVFLKSRFVRNVEVCVISELLQKISAKNPDDYDFIIFADDESLGLVANSDLPLEHKLKLLPITDAAGLNHIFSKIGLSQTLEQHGVLTPPFFVVDNITQAKEAAEKLCYPVMIKRDSGNGGSGVFECKNFAEIEKLQPEIFDSSILVQKKIEGELLDLSAIYRDKKLLFFAYSQIKEVISNKFGPSVLRLYNQLGNVNNELFLIMQKVGEALNANGFSNISCIKTPDNKIYFFEVDMRPNVWVEFPKFFGDDPAIKIATWFNKKEQLSRPAINYKYPKQLILPYFHRMEFREILLNRDQVWKYLPYNDWKLLYHSLKQKILFRIRHKRVGLKTIYVMIKRLPLKFIRLFIPCKKERAEIRNKIKYPIIKLIKAFGVI